MRTAIGLMLVNAPHSALNNAGIEAGERTEETVRTKKVYRGRDTFPYVSGQAVRYWWRTTLESKYDWDLSPLEREKKIVYSEANPLEYPDDDVFGYMRAPKGRGSETVTRTSPLKVSPLISVTPQEPTTDQGVASRHEGDPVPYKHEFYSTVLRGIFALDIDQVGVFTNYNKTGYKNITKKLEETLHDSDAEEDGGEWSLPQDTRRKRAKETLEALPHLFGGAMSSRHLTDVTPKFLVMSLINGGNQLFMDTVYEENKEPKVDIDAILEIARDYKEEFLTPVYIGRRQGFMNELEDEIQSKLLESDTPVEFQYASPKETTEQFAEKLVSHIQ